MRKSHPLNEAGIRDWRDQRWYIVAINVLPIWDLYFYFPLDSDHFIPWKRSSRSWNLARAVQVNHFHCFTIIAPPQTTWTLMTWSRIEKFWFLNRDSGIIAQIGELEKARCKPFWGNFPRKCYATRYLGYSYNEDLVPSILQIRRKSW